MRPGHREVGVAPSWTGACAAVALAVVATCGPAAAGSFGLELTGAEQGFSPAGGAAWGFWEPGKYAGWWQTADDGLGLVGGRAVFGGDDYTVFFAAELYPELEGAGTVPGGDPTGDELRLEIEVYDLVIAQTWEVADGVRLTPWAGPTRILIEEDRRPAGDPSAEADRARSRLWGAAVGADVAVRLTPRLELTGRLAARWAQGDRDAHVATDGGDDPAVGSAAVSDTVTRVMYGAEAGLRGRIVRAVHLEGGWRYRSWDERDGPGAFDGAYLRLILGL